MQISPSGSRWRRGWAHCTEVHQSVVRFTAKPRKHTTAARSSASRPLPTALMRTAHSFIPDALGWFKKWRMFALAWALLIIVTESSRSYATESTARPLVFSSILRDEPGTRGSREPLFVIRVVNRGRP